MNHLQRNNRSSAQESPAQSPEAGGVGDEGDEGDEGEESELGDRAAEPGSEPPAHRQAEAISSGPEREHTSCYNLANS